MTSRHGRTGAPKAGDMHRRGRQLLAWCVHAYTALGLILAASMAVLIVRGDDAAFRTTFALMLLATGIDATDGLFARAVHVQEVLPGFDGRQLDYLTDFLTYVALPLLLVWRAEILPPGWEACLIAPLVAGAYWFCQVEAKTSDGYFLGFPACWNVVALYLYILHRQVLVLPGWFSILVLVVLSVLTFVPTRYLYGTMGGRLNLIVNLLGLIWAGLLMWMVYCLPIQPGGLPDQAAWHAAVVWISLLFPLAYFVVSWYVSWNVWRRRSDASAGDVASGTGTPQGMRSGR